MRYYNKEVKGRHCVFANAVKAVYQHFNSEDVQQRTKLELSELSFDSFVEKNGSKAKGLSALANHIRTRTPQCPPGFQSEANKIDFLKRAVKHQTWAAHVLTNFTPNMSFHELYTKLSNALQLNTELPSSASTSGSAHSKLSKPMIYFTQPRVIKSMAKAMFPGSARDMKCWNCGIPGYVVSKCHKELDLGRIAANKAEYLAK